MLMAQDKAINAATDKAALNRFMIEFEDRLKDYM